MSEKTVAEQIKDLEDRLSKIESQGGTKPDVPWSVIKWFFKYAAKDENGCVWLFQEKPFHNAPNAFVRGWSGGLQVFCASGFLEIDPGTCHWSDSLVERPKNTA